jgi:hypothetical protein
VMRTRNQNHLSRATMSQSVSLLAGFRGENVRPLQQNRLLLFHGQLKQLPLSFGINAKMRASRSKIRKMNSQRTQISPRTLKVQSKFLRLQCPLSPILSPLVNLRQQSSGVSAKILRSQRSQKRLENQGSQKILTSPSRSHHSQSLLNQTPSASASLLQQSSGANVKMRVHQPKVPSKPLPLSPHSQTTSASANPSPQSSGVNAKTKLIQKSQLALSKSHQPPFLRSPILLRSQ